MRWEMMTKFEQKMNIVNHKLSSISLDDTDSFFGDVYYNYHVSLKGYHNCLNFPDDTDYEFVSSKFLHSFVVDGQAYSVFFLRLKK